MGILFPYAIYLLNNLYFKKIGLTPPPLLRLNVTLLKNIIIGFLLGLLALYLSGLLFYFQTNDINNFFFKVSFPLIVFNILTAIGEEIIFRGTLLNVFAQKNKRYLGLIISAIIFALIHLLNVLIGQEVSISHILTLILA
ncbi:CPBP family intramembrane glutamic endopeptidase [Wocania arenilitoris]|uniref:CPBP family intramembrane glutamic endopeptidase n=1 Tax=Wocania arenilitoris TaxID=2044858 RepID=UPI0034E2A164